jgi:hypothetical protein
MASRWGTLSRSGGEMARVSSFSSGVPVTLGAFYRLNATPAGRQRCALPDNLRRYDSSLGNPNALLNSIGGLAFRQPRLTHDRFSSAPKEFCDMDGGAGTKSPNRPQYFVVRNDQSCAGGETADISIPSPGAKVSRLARMII